jgi:hypothetical protein
MLIAIINEIAGDGKRIIRGYCEGLFGILYFARPGSRMTGPRAMNFWNPRPVIKDRLS